MKHLISLMVIIIIITMVIVSTPLQAFAAEGDTEEENVIVNINTANVEQLETLMYIGPVKAARIVAYRVKHGNFKKLADLKKVRGIGKGIVKLNRERMAVD